jgi:hypothetical protein
MPARSPGSKPTVAVAVAPGRRVRVALAGCGRIAKNHVLSIVA